MWIGPPKGKLTTRGKLTASQSTDPKDIAPATHYLSDALDAFPQEKPRNYCIKAASKVELCSPSSPSNSGLTRELKGMVKILICITFILKNNNRPSGGVCCAYLPEGTSPRGKRVKALKSYLVLTRRNPTLLNLTPG